MKATAHKLTKREKEVLGWMGLGMTNDQIAKKMNIAYDTLRSHITMVYEKTGKTRYEIISEGKK